MNKEQRTRVIETIEYVLATASAPMTSVQIAQHPDMEAINAGVDNTSRLLWQLVTAKHKPFPIARIPYHGPGSPQWEYYDPSRINPLISNALRDDEQAEPEVNTVNPTLELNPLDFTDEGEFRGFGSTDPTQLAVGTASETATHKRSGEPSPQSVRIDLPGIAITITYNETEAV